MRRQPSSRIITLAGRAAGRIVLYLRGRAKSRRQNSLAVLSGKINGPAVEQRVLGYDGLRLRAPRVLLAMDDLQIIQPARHYQRGNAQQESQRPDPQDKAVRARAIEHSVIHI